MEIINNNNENVYIFSKVDDPLITIEGNLCIQSTEIYFETSDNVYFYNNSQFVDSSGIILIFSEYESNLIKSLLNF